MRLYADVLIEFLSKAEGGREFLPNLNNAHYRPHFRVNQDNEYLGVEFLSGPNMPVAEREKVNAKIVLLYYPELSYSQLVEGAEFEILEGAKVVGNGTVVKRYNQIIESKLNIKGLKGCD